MNINIAKNIRYTLSTIRNSFIPALIFATALIMYYAYNPYGQEYNTYLHIAFFIITTINLSLLYITNQSKPFFLILLSTICYITINNLKNTYGIEYIHSTEYLCISLFLPIYILILYYIPQRKLKQNYNKYLLIILFFQMALIQHYSHFINIIPYLNITIGTIPIIFLILWLILFVVLLINISTYNTLLNIGQFYTISSLFMGIIYPSISSLTTFFLCSSIISCYSIISELYHRYHFDYLENVGSFNSYLIHANTKFPFKYTIAIFNIDNRDKLIKVIGNKKMQILEQLLVNKILEYPQDIAVYRYNENELIIVFKNENAKHSIEYADTIRHDIAASEFILSHKTKIKITISICVSEKTRKDIDATEVTNRAHNALQKAYRFNCNITTKI